LGTRCSGLGDGRGKFCCGLWEKEKDNKNSMGKRVAHPTKLVLNWELYGRFAYVKRRYKLEREECVEIKE
jgi:hypothetical protein